MVSATAFVDERTKRLIFIAIIITVVIISELECLFNVIKKYNGLINLSEISVKQLQTMFNIS